MTKYDVELITDKHGKPMPQYFDDQEGIMKPITKDNFDGTINGSVDVEFPDVQRVEVTNAQTQMDVNVLNPVDNVSVNNLPTDYPDQAVEARLQAIEQTQSQILDKLNDTIDTRLTGSNVEDGILTKSAGVDLIIEDDSDYDSIESYYDTACLSYEGWVRYNRVPTNAINISKYKKLAIGIFNDGDGEIDNITVQVGVTNERERYEHIREWGYEFELPSIPVGSRLMVDFLDEPILDGAWAFITIRARFRGESGTVSTKISGVKR